MRHVKEIANNNINRIKENTREIKNLKEHSVCIMLAERKTNGRYMYSYQEVATEFGVSIGTVSNIASQNGLSRLVTG